MINWIMSKFGYIKKADVDEKLNFARHISKRLDEHREVVESAVKSNFFDNNEWHIGHMATQDDYLMRLFYMVVGEWPDDSPIWRNKVRKRPNILGECELPEYRSK